MSGMSMALIATLAAASGALFGLSLTGVALSARRLFGFSGGLLVGIALFGLLPELAQEIGLTTGVLALGAGYLLLFAIDRFVYPVCPACSHDHDHGHCATELHGFGPPLILAAAFHAFLDGWSIATSQSAGALALRMSLPVALALHKIPEGVALGAILRAAMRSRGWALCWCLIAEAATLIGAGAGLRIAERVGARWLHYPLAAAGGAFLYLGWHAIEAEWRKRRTWSAIVPGVTGAAGAAMLQHGVQVLFR